jgi:hypothetical protein
MPDREDLILVVVFPDVSVNLSRARRTAKLRSTIASALCDEVLSQRRADRHVTPSPTA